MWGDVYARAKHDSLATSRTASRPLRAPFTTLKTSKDPKLPHAVRAVAEQQRSSRSSSASYTNDEARAIGCLVGAMCGDALALPASGQKSHRVVAEFPRGLTEFYRFTLDSPCGSYTGITRQLLAVAKTLAAEELTPASLSKQYATMFDPTRTYLPYDRLVFTVLKLNHVFNAMVDALAPVLRANGVAPESVDHKMYIMWFREYVDVFGGLGAEGDMGSNGAFAFLGIEEEQDPDELYQRYQQRLVTRTLRPDPLGLRRLSGVQLHDEEYVQQAASDFALYVAVNWEYSYQRLMEARGYIRHTLKASPRMIPVLSWMWERFATAIRLPLDQTKIPTWWFSRFFSRSVDPDTQDIGIVEELLGSCHTALARRLQQELAVYRYTSTTVERMAGGPHDCGAPSRTAPLGLALQSATVQELRQAVQAALQCSHPEQTAVDASTVQAAAVQWLRSADPAHATPHALLSHLLEAAGTAEMMRKLLLVQSSAFDMATVADWRDGFRSADWHRLVQVHQWCSTRGLAEDAVDAVAVSLLLLCCNWTAPRQAVECATHLGGWSCATASMTGALCGALHGVDWIPSTWWDGLEDQDEGRDLAVALGRRLAQLDLKTTVSGAQDDGLALDQWYM